MSGNGVCVKGWNTYVLLAAMREGGGGGHWHNYEPLSRYCDTTENY